MNEFPNYPNLGKRDESADAWAVRSAALLTLLTKSPEDFFNTEQMREMLSSLLAVAPANVALAGIIKVGEIMDGVVA